MSIAPSEVLVEATGGVLIITIDRPDQRNAMTLAAATEIARALDELDASADLSVGVITGSGGSFCAGMDLKRFQAGERPSLPGRGFAGLVEAPPQKPLIAAVEGWALGGGFEIVLACDLVVAGRGARFGLPEVKRGLVARGGGMFRLPQRLPRAVALEMLLTGDPIDATRACELGLVNEVVETGAARAAAEALAARIAANAPLAIAASKRIAVAAADWPDAESFTRQQHISDAVFASEDAKEGAAAFAQKRAPIWQRR